MSKPELLLPVGNVEAFYAAIEGGADAIFVGLKAFNARGRATNFNNLQFLQLLNHAKANQVKVYVTLNTVIKNSELFQLLDTLWFLSKTKVDAVIIQDWGTYYLIRNSFQNLKIHASTQMAIHNTLGLIHSKKMNFERVILARELTMSELTQIQKKSPIETEIFVHGALCYSFSGMCLYSSYMGGASANRGLCTQPCRRFYNVNGEHTLTFSLKDNQLIEQVDEFAKIGVSSLKVEGRIKSGEYVFHVAKAYRDILDGKISLDEAKENLKLDMGREKTQWFFSKDVKNSLTERPNTGILIGIVVNVLTDSIIINTTEKLQEGNRIRIETSKTQEQLPLKINSCEQLDDNILKIYCDVVGVKQGNKVFLAGINEHRFPNKLKGTPSKISEVMPLKLKKKIIDDIRNIKSLKKQLTFIRINSYEWLQCIDFNSIDQLIVQFTKKDWLKFNPENPIFKKNTFKIWIELPQFISENDITYYRSLCESLFNKGYKSFSLSHISQKELLPKGVRFMTNENTYCYNDAAASVLYGEGAIWVTSPFENEYENLLTGKNRAQIIPMYYFPKLFFSRQPVKISDVFSDDNKNQFRKIVRDGITIIIPVIPVALFQFQRKLAAKGFNQFLIDLSFTKANKQTLIRLMNKLKASESEQPSTSFNFKKGFK